MRLSQKTFAPGSQSIKKSFKRPKQLITRLNNQISSIQANINQYNRTEQDSLRWKKQMNLEVNSCQLKTLTQPKLQNILLESNFINNMSIFSKNMNQSGMKSSILKKRNTFNKNSMYSSSGFGLRKTMSLKVDGSNYNKNKKNQNQLRKSQNCVHINNNSKANKEFFEENPQTEFRNQGAKFGSFRQEVGKFDKLVYLSKNYKQNYSNKRPTSQISKQQSVTPSKNTFSQSLLFNQVQGDVSTVIDEESESIMMQSSMKLLKSQFGFNHESKQLGLLPISEQKLITLNSQRNSRNLLRKRIESKTLMLQKQWLRTEFYRQKFNILPGNQTSNQVGKSRVKRSISKLATIIQRVQQRRPSTSVSYQKTLNGSRQTTMTTQQLIKQKSKTVSKQQNLQQSKFDFQYC